MSTFRGFLKILLLSAPASLLAAALTCGVLYFTLECFSFLLGRPNFASTIYIYIFLVITTVLSVLISLLYLYESRKFSEDPQRFNRIHHRSLVVPDSSAPDFLSVLKKLGYEEPKIKNAKGTTTISAIHRKHFRKPEIVFTKAKVVGERRVSVRLTKSDNGFTLIKIEIAPTKFYEFADFSLSNFVYMEELLKVASLKL